jgi:hypothetical protein
MEKLTREEMKSIKGGVAMPPSTCSANCISGTVTCTGSGCEAHDAVGGINGNCSADGQTKYC